MRRRILIALAGLLGLAIIVGYVRWFVPTQQAVEIGAGMLSKQVCSCLFVAGRSVEDCRADQYESMDRIKLEVLQDPPAVRAFVPLLGERIAVWRDGFGCTLQ